MIGNCKLCLAQGVELKNSHIIPEFNYKPCYDTNHRFIRLSNTGPKHKTLVQKGYREYLLCQSCETKLSVWEGYSHRILTKDGLHLVDENELGFTVGGADYDQFKLYGMSLIWRMGISSLPMFDQVQLGPHSERLRLALHSGDSLAPNKYPFLLTAVQINDKFQPDIIVPPTCAKDAGQTTYRCLIGGLLYTFIVGSHSPDPKLVDMAVSKQGMIKIPVVSIDDVPFLRDHLLEIARVAK